MGLINMPHFGWLNEENACTKQLLAYFHGRILWLDKMIAVMVALISEITWLPKDGTDPSQYFRGRDNDKRLVEKLNKRYGLQRDRRAYHVDIINDLAVHFGARIFPSKIVRQNRPNQCNSWVIACVEQCAKGVEMNWLLFLMNQLMEDAMAVQAGRGCLHIIGY